ncbi:uncharacterized protein K460DRAFT_193910 [Cucurbitaria berberidis CBS 394.84]|uniref:Uncharacterized protein n=1 Tax=Cucurbitaria berberidis CBS 394.84 TaxID=1168544 RepID=A0A9P4L4H0_9PLEO|nr:uncharacterized protein K460DRAFT_193910 [Cucurbitaria berberidis CBS 394.84]KAF1840878.1 hypothetical protein K460DRAFT_193910 [Cucurbitaria berberidis CBS 394.84]
MSPMSPIGPGCVVYSGPQQQTTQSHSSALSITTSIRSSKSGTKVGLKLPGSRPWPVKGPLLCEWHAVDRMISCAGSSRRADCACVGSSDLSIHPAPIGIKSQSQSQSLEYSHSVHSTRF